MSYRARCHLCVVVVYLQVLLLLHQQQEVKGDCQESEHPLLLPEAFQGDKYSKDTDIFKDEAVEAKREAVAQAQPVFQGALQYIRSQRSGKGNETILQQELASIDPRVSQCAWLQLEHHDRAGLGHTFSCWGKGLADAIANSLTYHAPFFSSAHEVCDLNATTHYFGLHSAFYWANAPPVAPLPFELVHVGDAASKKGCSSKMLAETVSNYTRDRGPFSCEKKGHVVFLCHNENEDFGTRTSRSMVGWETPVRGVFLAAAKYREQHQHPLFLAARAEKKLILVVHMRRGDVLRSKRIDHKHRLVSFQVYVNIIEALLATKKKHGDVRPIAIFFLCEGSPDSSHVEDYNPDNPRNVFPVDAVQALAPFCKQSEACSAQVLHDANFLSSFSAMCNSDILVTSTSGFSLVGAGLCQPPLTAAIRFSMDYSGIRGVVEVNNLGPWFRRETKIVLPNIDEAWKSAFETKAAKYLRN